MTDALLRELIAGQRELIAGQQRIIVLLEQHLRPPVSLSRSDRAALSRILPAIGGVCGSELFATRELFESEEPALRVVLAGLTPTTAGQLFGRANGQPVDGYQIESGGSEMNVTLWRVMKVHGVQPSGTLIDSPRATVTSR